MEDLNLDGRKLGGIYYKMNVEAGLLMMALQRLEPCEEKFSCTVPRRVAVGNSRCLSDRKRYDGTRDIRELIDAPQDLIEQYLLKSFHLIDTHDIEDEELRKQHWSGLMEFVMKHVYEKETLNYIQFFLGLIKDIAKNKGSEDFLMTVLKYYLSQANTSDPDRLKKILELGLSESKEGEIMGTLANYLIEQGMQKGMQQGRQEGKEEGRQEGRFTFLIHQLERKFGAVPHVYRELIQKADSDTLLQWAGKVLEANNIQTVFDEN